MGLYITMDTSTDKKELRKRKAYIKSIMKYATGLDKDKLQKELAKIDLKLRGSNV